jgi:hypothetical protein
MKLEKFSKHQKDDIYYDYEKLIRDYYYLINYRRKNFFLKFMNIIYFIILQNLYKKEEKILI